VWLQGFVKIGDFGFAKVLESNNRTYTFCGTPGYVAPENGELTVVTAHRHAGACSCQEAGLGNLTLEALLRGHSIPWA
jgi:serine/threonine protein kinase